MHHRAEDAGASTVVGVVLIAALVLLLGGLVADHLMGTTDRLQRSSLAAADLAVTDGNATANGSVAAELVTMGTADRVTVVVSGDRGADATIHLNRTGDAASIAAGGATTTRGGDVAVAEAPEPGENVTAVAVARSDGSSSVLVERHGQL